MIERTQLLALIGIFVVTACESGDHDSPDSEEALQTANFDVIGGSETQARWLEDQYQATRSILGVSLPEGKRVLYRFWGHPDCRDEYCDQGDYFELNCSSTNDDCPKRLTGLVIDLLGDAPAFMRDGLSEVLAGGLAYSTFELPVLSPEEITTYIDESRYLSARLDREREVDEQVGRFMRILIDEIGLSKVIELYSVSGNLDSWPALTGRTLQEWAAHANDLMPPFAQERNYRMPVTACQQPALRHGEETRAPAIQGAPIYAPRLSNHRSSAAVFTIEVLRRETIAVRVRGDHEPYLFLESCDGNLAEPFVAGVRRVTSPSDIVSRSAVLDPGRYFIVSGLSFPEGNNNVSILYKSTPAPN